MPGRHPNALRPADRRADPVIEDAVGKGFIGSGEPYPIDGITGHQSANQGRLSVVKSARRMNISVSAWVVDSDGKQCWKNCKDPDAPHGIRFRLFSKEQGRAFVTEISQGDPSKLRYNPFRKKGTKLNDDGTRAE
jgi:hypothetical protein